MNEKREPAIGCSPFSFYGILCSWVIALLPNKEAGSCPPSRARIPKWNYWSEDISSAKGSDIVFMTATSWGILMLFYQNIMLWCSSMDVSGMGTKAVPITKHQKTILPFGSRRLKKTGSVINEYHNPCLIKAGGSLLSGSVNSEKET